VCAPAKVVRIAKNTKNREVSNITVTIVSAADGQAGAETIDFVASRMLRYYKSTNNFTTKHPIQEVSGSN
jgi:hypothetical protein